jgi:hypothetical protein
LHFAAHLPVLLSFQAGKLIANLIVMGSGIVGRAMLQAYRKALHSKFLFHDINYYPQLKCLPPHVP